MSFFLTIGVALRALRKNKLRAGLTVLGVVIGIAAVTTMVSIGESAGALVQGQLQGLGTNVVLVFPGSSQNKGARVTTVQTLTAKDSDAIAAECPAVLAASPMVGTSGQAVYGNVNWNPGQMYGVGPDYLTVRNWALQAGDFFTERDVSSAGRVCVIGHTLVPKLFQTSNPVGQMIRIKNIPLLVIGVLEKRGADLVGRDQDDIVLMPYTTVQKRLQGSSFDTVNLIMVSARTEKQMIDAEDEIRRLLLDRHRIHPGELADFDLQSRDRHRPDPRHRHGHDHGLAVGDRRHLAAGRRRGHHEHHARVGDRAHPRNRHPHGRRRAVARHPAAVLVGGGAVERAGRRGRRGAGDRRVGGGHVGHQRVHGRCEMADCRLVPGRGGGARVRGGGGDGVRLLPGAAREQARSDRCVAV